jgi:hypothetical protein
MTNYLRAAASALVLSAAFALPALPALAEPPLTVTLKDGHAAPAEVHVAAGKIFTLTVVNKGKSTAEFDSPRLQLEKAVPPAHKLVLKMALPAGRYGFLDTRHKTAKGEIVAK